MLDKPKHSDRGFTIIEVLIVLAIAGLILLIVFLAVPALQRNNRNSQYRSEAAQLLVAASEYTNNNNGAVIPSTGAASAAIVGLTKNKMITVIPIQIEGGGDVPPANTYDQAILRTGAKCNSARNETDPGSAHGIAILYNIEKGNGESILTCIDQ